MYRLDLNHLAKCMLLPLCPDLPPVHAQACGSDTMLLPAHVAWLCMIFCVGCDALQANTALLSTCLGKDLPSLIIYLLP